MAFVSVQMLINLDKDLFIYLLLVRCVGYADIINLCLAINEI